MPMLDNVSANRSKPMSESKIRLVVIVPGNAATGGVELLYQFADAANLAGAKTVVCNYPFQLQSSVPDSYQVYDCPTIARSDVQASDIIVLPEVFTYLSDEFPENVKYLWWMSVDNYYGSSSIRYAIANRFRPWRYESITKKSFSHAFDGHLCQSQYAVDHLLAHGIGCDFTVSDYINRDFVDGVDLTSIKSRKDLVVYNPAKGVEQTKRIIELSKFEFKPIVNMTRPQIKDLLLSAKIYIDFGNHPGKDRIPREAAALGCVVLTNRRGSAYNDIDVPIAPGLKIDDTKQNFAKVAAHRIEDIINNFETYFEKLDDYRRVISCEKSRFLESVATFVRTLEEEQGYSDQKS